MGKSSQTIFHTDNIIYCYKRFLSILILFFFLAELTRFDCFKFRQFQWLFPSLKEIESEVIQFQFVTITVTPRNERRKIENHRGKNIYRGRICILLMIVHKCLLENGSSNFFGFRLTISIRKFNRSDPIDRICISEKNNLRRNVDPFPVQCARSNAV